MRDELDWSAFKSIENERSARAKRKKREEWKAKRKKLIEKRANATIREESKWRKAFDSIKSILIFKSLHFQCTPFGSPLVYLFLHLLHSIHSIICVKIILKNRHSNRSWDSFLNHGKHFFYFHTDEIKAHSRYFLNSI